MYNKNMDVNSFVKEIIDNAEKTTSAPEKDRRFDNPLNVIREEELLSDAIESEEKSSENIEESAKNDEESLEKIEEPVENCVEEPSAEVAVEEPFELTEIEPEELQKIMSETEEEPSESDRSEEISSEYEAVTLPLVNDEYPVADGEPKNSDDNLQAEEVAESIVREENPKENLNEFLIDIRAELDEIKEEESLRPVRAHEKSELLRLDCRFRRKSVINKPFFFVGLVLLALGGFLSGAGVALITGGLESISVILLTLSAEVAVILYIAIVALGAILAIIGAVLFALALKNRRTEFVMKTVSVVPDYNGKRLDKDTMLALKEREIKRTKNSL